MLDLKNKQIMYKEQELKLKEANLEQQKSKMLQIIRDEFALQYKESEAKLNKEYKAMQKKFNEAERNLQNKLKLL